MKAYYLITWSLDVFPLGEHENFDSANTAAAKEFYDDDIMYIADIFGIKRLKEQIKTIEI